MSGREVDVGGGQVLIFVGTKFKSKFLTFCDKYFDHA